MAAAADGAGREARASAGRAAVVLEGVERPSPAGGTPVGRAEGAEDAWGLPAKPEEAGATPARFGAAKEGAAAADAEEDA